MRLFLGLFFSATLCFTSLAFSKTAPPLSADKKWLEQELHRLQLPKSFIAKALQTYEPDSFKTVVSLNLLGFLQQARPMNNVTPQSVRESASFIQQNKVAFASAAETYQVPANVISSLLWIETRHGEDVGTFHTCSVYLDLLQSDLPKNRHALTEMALEKNQKIQKYTAADVRRLIRERTKARKLWAKEQLGNLAVLSKRHQLDIRSLRGSYAGAFGLPQFIPSSYKEYARSLKPSKPANLNNQGDAIVSVANYLAKHGWDSQSDEARIAALMKYNNSRDYADSILEISRRVGGEKPLSQDRNVSSSAESAPVDQPAQSANDR